MASSPTGDGMIDVRSAAIAQDIEHQKNTCSADTGIVGPGAGPNSPASVSYILEFFGIGNKQKDASN